MRYVRALSREDWREERSSWRHVASASAVWQITGWLASTWTAAVSGLVICHTMIHLMDVIPRAPAAKHIAPTRLPLRATPEWLSVYNFVTIVERKCPAGVYNNPYTLRQVNGVNSGDIVFVRRVSVCVFVLSVRSGPVNQTSLKRLKLWHAFFQGQSREHDPLKLFEKGRGQGHVTPKFLGVKC